MSKNPFYSRFSVLTFSMTRRECRLLTLHKHCSHIDMIQSPKCSCREFGTIISTLLNNVLHSERPVTNFIDFSAPQLRSRFANAFTDCQVAPSNIQLLLNSTWTNIVLLFYYAFISKKCWSIGTSSVVVQNCLVSIVLKATSVNYIICN